MTQPDNIRYHYLDNLRAMAMLVGVFFHAGLAYSPVMEEVWISADGGGSFLMEMFLWVSHMFRMPLFFLISGFFAHMLIKKRGVLGLLKNRALRILLPFLIFLPLVIVSSILLCFYAYDQLGIRTPLLSLLVSALRGQSDVSPSLTTSHLWFLFNLLEFYVVIALLYKLGLDKARYPRWFASAWFPLLVFPLLLVPAIATKMKPTPAPENIYPELWSFGFFGVFFVIGWLYFVHQLWAEHLKKHWWWMLLASAAGFAVYYVQIPSPLELELMATDEGRQQHGFHLWAFLGSVAGAFVSAYGTLLSLYVGILWLNKQSTLLRLMADASYWIYLMHLPVLFFIQFQLMRFSWNWSFKFALSSALTLLVGVITYLLFVRYSYLGTMLNGKRMRWKSTSSSNSSSSVKP